MTLASDLDIAIAAVCPVDCVSIGNKEDRSTWKFTPTEAATPQEISLGQAVVDSFSWVDIPDGVSARQFKLQLLASGLLDQVDAWISTQPKAVQIAYEYSGTFLREDPVMNAGFLAMGFSPDAIRAFFLAASVI